MQSELECTICMEDFDIGVRQPMMLPCNHTFCSKCTKEIYKSNGFECPVCFQPHKIPQKKIMVNKKLLAQLKDFKKKGPEQSEDDMCKKFALEYLGNNVEQARAILITYDWNYEVAAQNLDIMQNKFQSYAQIDLDGKGPYHKEEKIKLLMKKCSMIEHVDQAQFLLEDNDWHVESVLKLYEQQSSVMDQINSNQQNNNYQHSSSLIGDIFGNPKNNELTASGFEKFDYGNQVVQVQAMSPDSQDKMQNDPFMQFGQNMFPAFGGSFTGSEKLQILLTNTDDKNDSFLLEFDKENSFGMQIIEKLVQLKPLFGKGENAVYNIYRDQQKTRCINYMMLSNNLKNLQIESQPSAPGYPANCRIIYFALDFEMKFE